MAREYHSPSSIELGRRCKRAWAYRYIAGLRKPEEPWRPGLKGAPLGKAMHATLEAYFTGGTPDWIWFPGEVAASGIGLLPPAADRPRVELALGVGEHGVTLADGKRAVDIAGTRWLGYRDLVDPSGRQGPFLYDYKSTRSIQRYAKSTAELLQDLQANLYAYDTMTDIGTDELLCRWVYFETDRVRRAEARDFVVRRAEALSVIESASEFAKELDAITEVDQAPCNTSACADFGGCEFHVKAGGPCNARTSPGALIQARVRKDHIMPLDPSARQALLSKTPAAVKPAPVAAPETPPADNVGATVFTQSLAEHEDGVGAPPAPAKPRKAARSAVGASGSLAAIAAELTEAEAAASAAQAALDAAKARMRSALDA